MIASHEQTHGAVRAGLMSGLKILVIEDDSTLRELIQETIHSVGGQVITAGSGHSALEFFHTAKESHDPFTVAVVDLRMPGLGGIEILEKLRRLDERVMLTAMSGAQIDAKTNAFFEQSNIGFLQKPFSLQQLLEALIDS
jgi:CheY-like chemotaxis protein